MIIILRHEVALVRVVVPPPPHPNSTSSASMAPCLSTPPTAARQNRISGGSAPRAPKPSSDTPPAHIRFLRTTARTASPASEISPARKEETASPTTALRTTRPKRTTARQLLSLRQPPLPNLLRGL